MENNLPTNQTNQTQTFQQQMPPISPQPSAQQPVPQMPPQQGVPVKRGHIIRTLLIVIVFALLVILGIYIYLSSVNKQPDSSSVQIENAISPVPTKTAEQEINNIDVGNIEDDLKEVDADLQGL